MQVSRETTKQSWHKYKKSMTKRQDCHTPSPQNKTKWQTHFWSQSREITQEHQKKAPESRLWKLIKDLRNFWMDYFMPQIQPMCCRRGTLLQAQLQVKVQQCNFCKFTSVLLIHIPGPYLFLQVGIVFISVTNAITSAAVKTATFSSFFLFDES